MLTERSLKRKDILPLFKLLSDKHTSQMLGFGKPLSISQVSRYMTVNKDDMRIFEDSHGDFVGFIKMSITDALPRVTVAVAKEERGKGYATYMYRYLIQSGVECMEAIALTTNTASIKVMKKCGFKKLPYTNNHDKVVYLYRKDGGKC